jgi:hypothetical protein
MFLIILVLVINYPAMVARCRQYKQPQGRRADDPAKVPHVPANRAGKSAENQRYPESQSTGVVPAARSSSSLSQVISIVPVRAAVAA